MDRPSTSSRLTIFCESFSRLDAPQVQLLTFLLHICSESFFAHPTAYNFTTDAMYSTTSIEANNLHPSDRANMYLAKKMERFILENARGAQLINGTM
jgi:hypothetical protein